MRSDAAERTSGPPGARLDNGGAQWIRIVRSLVSTVHNALDFIRQRAAARTLAIVGTGMLFVCSFVLFAFAAPAPSLPPACP
eukprot:4717107-Pyramimonas_sp.AAC.1